MTVITLCCLAAGFASGQNAETMPLDSGWEFHQSGLGSIWVIWRGERASDNVVWSPVTPPHYSIACFSPTHGRNDTRSFPLGTGPKPYEIWRDGYYPVVWTNVRYKMIYLNIGHNDMDYEHKFDNTNRTLSFTFENERQRRLMLDALL
jgi:hypothetical protein